MKEIGGYFELELARKKEYHRDAIKLNSGRNAFKYILHAQNINKVYIPALICNSVIEPLIGLEISYEFYNVDEKYEILQEILLEENERLLYPNYYSLKSIYIQKLAKQYGERLIIDNTQSFFEKPIECIDTIYSPRKYFGVCDGGYLYTKKYLEEDLDRDVSYNNAFHLLGRADISASDFYDKYQESEERVAEKQIRKMSKLTSKILSSIDYESVKRIRERNFHYLHGELCKHNQICIDMSTNLPFMYPLMIDDGELRNKLISNKIYVAKYWTEVLDRKQSSESERELVNKIIPLPIDQRYGLNDMKRIVEIIKDELE